MDAILSGERLAPLPRVEPAGLHLLAPTTVAFEDLESDVGAAFESAIHRLSAAGARIDTTGLPEFTEVATMNAGGGFAAYESYAWHRDLIERHGDQYDPRVLGRIMRGAAISAVDYAHLIVARRGFIQRVERRIGPYDALVLPTVAIEAPQIDALSSEDAYLRANQASLRNTALVNMMDGCAVSLPINAPDERPVGMMLAARGGADRRLIGIAASVETIVRPR
jgi:aspartyl-tRNA(Asn)/glutamyl-tRNA(Gln) amidotransferase subunit A